MPTLLPKSFSEELAERETAGRLRRLKSVVPGAGATILVDNRELINFGSNDYLGLSGHPLVKARAIEYIQRYGAGSTASRLVSGNLELYDQIESKLARLKGTEAALILPTGFQANVTVLAALLQGKSLSALDRLSHNSLLEGARTASTRWLRYKHNDLSDLKNRLCQTAVNYDKRWIISESVFSMDGDRADLQALAEIGRSTNSLVYIDEAHATGVLGKNGMGLTVGVSGITIAMGTFGKACGSFGAYVACSQELKDYLVNFCSGMIYSTSLPPAVLGAIDAALDLIPGMENQRQQLLTAADSLRNRLQKLGFETPGSTQIIPIVIGHDRDASSLSDYLEKGGIFAPAIRPPTVPDGSARVRLSLTSRHTSEQADQLVRLMGSWHAG